MRLPRSTCASSQSAALVAMLTVLAAGSAVAAAPPTEAPPAPVPAVTVTDPGDPATATDLTPVRSIGTAYSVTTNEAFIGAQTGAQGGRLDVAVTMMEHHAVTAAPPDGGYTTVGMYDSIDVTANVDEVGFADAFSTFDALVALAVETVTGPDDVVVSFGVPTGAAPTAEQSDLVAELAASGESSPGLPATPVGVGATWTSTATLGPADVRVPIVYDCVLTSLTNGRFVVEFSAVGDVTGATVLTDLQGASLSGEISVSGTISGSVTSFDNVLTSRQHERYVVALGGQQAAMEYDHWREAITTTAP